MNVKDLIAVNFQNNGKLYQVGWFNLHDVNRIGNVGDYICITDYPEMAEPFFDKQDVIDVINEKPSVGTSYIRRIKQLKSEGYVLTPEKIDFDELTADE